MICYKDNSMIMIIWDDLNNILLFWFKTLWI